MKLTTSSILFAAYCLAMLGAASHATAEDTDIDISQQPNGYYVTDGGWGKLFLSAGRSDKGAGSKHFKIETAGDTGDLCRLEGTLSSNGKILFDNDDNGDLADKCLINFAFNAKGTEISETATSTSCQDFCGMRAHFTGFYNYVPKTCAPENIQIAIKAFDTSRTADEMSIATTQIGPMLRVCGQTIKSEDAAELSIRLALAQYHAHHKAACRAALASYQEVISGPETDPGASLTEEYIWLPLIKRIRDTLDLCR